MLLLIFSHEHWRLGWWWRSFSFCFLSHLTPLTSAWTNSRGNTGWILQIVPLTTDDDSFRFRKNHVLTWAKSMRHVLDLSRICFRGYHSICLQSEIKGEGWRPANAKVSYFWGAIWSRLSRAQIWMSQSRSHQRAPFGFINSHRRSSLSIIGVIKMFCSRLAQTWNIFTDGVTSEVQPLASEKFSSSFSRAVQENKMQQSNRVWNQFAEVVVRAF